jgi:DNA-binding MarR family transcriptional regulator
MNGIIGLILLTSVSTVSSYNYAGRVSFKRSFGIPDSCKTIRVTQSTTRLAAEVKAPIEDENMSEQFKEWEAEEEEIQRRELEDTVRKARADGTEDELPDYMMRSVIYATK